VHTIAAAEAMCYCFGAVCGWQRCCCNVPAMTEPATIRHRPAPAYRSHQAGTVFERVVGFDEIVVVELTPESALLSHQA